MRALHFWTLLLVPISAAQAMDSKNARLNDNGRFCNDIWTGHNHNDTGSICVQVEHESSEYNYDVLLSYHLDNNWQLHEHYLWIGGNITDVPQVNGKPDIDNFPFVERDLESKEYMSTYQTTIPISRGQFPVDCNNGETTFHMAVHPVLLPLDSSLSLYQNSTEMNSPRNNFLRGNTKSRDSSLYGFSWIEYSIALPCQRKPNPNQQEIGIAPEKTQQDPMSSIQYEYVQRHHQLTSKRRQLSNIESCTPLPADVEPSKILNDDFFFKFYNSYTLAGKVVYDRRLQKKVSYYRGMYEHFDAFSDGLNDAAVVAKVDDVCYAVFRGTSEFNPFDSAQNLLPGFRKVPGTDCFVRKGLYGGYFTNYQADFEASVRECVNSCEGGHCELVLSGGSQGAAIAVVASIYLFKEYNPLLLSIGVMRTFLPTSPFNREEVCTHFNEDRHYHFTLTDSEAQVYDAVPYLYAFWVKNAGHEILYDGEGNFNYQKQSHNYVMAREPSSMAIHTRVNYLAKSSSAYDNRCLPVPSTGWRDGHWCSEDENCMTTSYCTDGGVCGPKLALEESCTRGTSCESGSCVAGQCSLEEVPLLENGTKCRQSDECQSGRCEGMWGFSTCQAKEERGGKCNEHSDCQSGHCAGLICGTCL